jgi:hypothetical protein
MLFCSTEEPRKQPLMNGRIATEELSLGTSKEVVSVLFPRLSASFRGRWSFTALDEASWASSTEEPRK